MSPATAKKSIARNVSAVKPALKAAPNRPNPPWMLKARDLAEVKYWVACTNTTTKTDVPPSSSNEIVEVSESGLQLRLPARSCAFGHALTLRIERRRSKPFAEPAAAPEGAKTSSGVGSGKRKVLWAVEDKIQLTAKVLEVEPSGPKLQLVTIQFYQCDQDHWQKFLKELAERQKAVTKLVRRMAE